jgi:hypothetical protein
MANVAEKIKVDPLRPADAGLFEHRVTRLDATVPGGYTTDQLEDPALWVNIANKMTMGTEVRCLADDMSFVAYGMCTRKRWVISQAITRLSFAAPRNGA